MGSSDDVMVYALDYVNGITYIGPQSYESRKDDISITPFISVPTVDLVNSEKGYAATAMEMINDARSGKRKHVLKDASPTSSKGRITSSKLESITVYD